MLSQAALPEPPLLCVRLRRIRTLFSAPRANERDLFDLRLYRSEASRCPREQSRDELKRAVADCLASRRNSSEKWKGKRRFARELAFGVALPKEEGQSCFLDARERVLIGGLAFASAFASLQAKESFAALRRAVRRMGANPPLPILRLYKLQDSSSLYLQPRISFLPSHLPPLPPSPPSPSSNTPPPTPSAPSYFPLPKLRPIPHSTCPPLHQQPQAPQTPPLSSSSSVPGWRGRSFPAVAAREGWEGGRGEGGGWYGSGERGGGM